MNALTQGQVALPDAPAYDHRARDSPRRDQAQGDDAQAKRADDSTMDQTAPDPAAADHARGVAGSEKYKYKKPAGPGTLHASR